MRRAWTVLLLLAARALPGQERLAEVVFMKPDPADKAVPPLYTRALDDVEPREWLKIPSARMALELYARAWDVADRRGLAKKQPKIYYVALVPDGNHPAIGFRLRGASGIEGFEEAAYIKLDPNEDFFRSTLLHETGHIAMAMISSGKGVEDTGIASLPHSNAALTDRDTAFQEGFGIHLETLAAHLIAEPGMRNRYRHEQFLLGPAAGRKSEYSRQAADLMTFAQVVGRYYDIRENSFAFDTAVTEPDYLRVQYEKSRDFANLRNANQLLQSEGFYASFLLHSDGARGWVAGAGYGPAAAGPDAGCAGRDVCDAHG